MSVVTFLPRGLQLFFKTLKHMQCCDGIFLFAETEVAITSLISPHVKDKNCIFTEYEIFLLWKDPDISCVSI